MTDSTEPINVQINPTSEETPEWDPVYEPLIKLLTHKKGLKTKDVVEVGKKVVTIIRGKDMKEFLTRETNLSMLKKRFPSIFTEATITEANVNAVGSKLLQNGFIIRVVDQGFKTGASEEEKKKPSWPERIAKAANQEYDPKGFYMIAYEGDPRFRYFLLGALVLVVLFLCMFPAWPMYLKVAGIHVMYILGFAYIILSIVRLVVFVIGWCFGCDFWIFPNLEDDYLGIVESFQPAYSFEWRNDTRLMTGIRLTSLVMIAVSMYQLSLNYTIQDVGDFIGSGYLDAVEWTVDKLTKVEKARALPSVEQILKETEKFVEGGEL
jgi:translocation protein SEC62